MPLGIRPVRCARLFNSVDKRGRGGKDGMGYFILRGIMTWFAMTGNRSMCENNIINRIMIVQMVGGRRIHPSQPQLVLFRSLCNMLWYSYKAS